MSTRAHGKIGVRVGSIGLLLLLLSVTGTGSASPYVPQTSRAKIDKVDISEAPLVKIYTTFLTGKGRPVKPETIRTAYIACANPDDPEAAPVQVAIAEEIKTFADTADLMDVGIVLPVSKRFPEEVQTQIKEGLANIIGQMRKEDRVAAFVDNGVGIVHSSLGAPADAAGYITDASPEGGGAFLYSGLERAITTLVEQGDPERRRAIILVTDGFDIETLRPDLVQTRLMDLYMKAKAEGVIIFVVMYKPIISELVPYFEGMARKTKGTYRETTSADGILRNVNYTFGEIYGQLVVEFEYEDVKEGDTCNFQIGFERDFGAAVNTRPFTEVQFEKIAFPWRSLIIWAIVAVVVLLLLLIIFLVVRRILRKRKAKKLEQNDEALQEKVEAGLVCGKCKRTMMAEWDECMFCARDAEVAAAAKKEEKAKKKEEKAAAKKDDAKKDAKKDDKKKDDKKKDSKKPEAGGGQCMSCGRVMMPGWTECLFCKAGIGGSAPMGTPMAAPPAGGVAAPPGGSVGSAGGMAVGAAMMAGGGGSGGRAAQGGAPEAERVCPKCKRAMKSHWDVCLFCEAGV